MENEIKQLKKQCRRTEIWAVIGLVISVIKFMQPMLHNMPGTAPSNTNSVQIGTTNGMDAAKPQRDYLRTDEVAEREGVAVRTVTEWVKDGRFFPMPKQHGRGWEFSVNYELLPSSYAKAPADKPSKAALTTQTP